VSVAAQMMKQPSTSIYRYLQTGVLDGLCADGQWFVDRRTVDKEIARRDAANLRELRASSEFREHAVA
jgi:hypothetical protein